MDTPPRFPNLMHRQALHQASKTSSGESYSVLSEQDRFWLHAYDYGFRRVFLQDRAGKSPIDRDGAWYSEKLADQVERMFLREKCAKQWGTCAQRWRECGYICCAGCRPMIPDYHMLSEDEARKRKDQYQRHRDWQKEWHLRVCAAYRWSHDQGRTMPPELDECCERVVNLVAEYEATWAQQDEEREVLRAKITGDGRNSDGSLTPETIAYVELCSQQARVNLTQFYARALPANWSPLASLQESLGLRVTEQDRDAG